MDNKRWYSRYGTIFWWTLAILPLVVTLIHFVGYHLAFNSGISVWTDLQLYQSAEQGNFFYLLGYYCLNGDFTFYEIQLPFINDMYLNLFQVLDIDTIGLGTLASLFGWMTSVAFYHVVYDFSVWIFNWIHSFFDRWGCFK